MPEDRLLCQNLGRVIRSHREKAGLSQEEFSHRVGLHRTYVGGIERGERNPTVSTLSRIAIGLGVSAGQILLEAEDLGS